MRVTPKSSTFSLSAVAGMLARVAPAPSESSDPAAGAELVFSHGVIRDTVYSKSTPQPFFALLKIFCNVA